MRIVIWTDAYWPEIGGLEVFCLRLVEGLKSRGHNCLVVANCDASRAVRHESVQGTDIHRFAFHQTLNRADLPSLRLMQDECERVISAFAPDLIHLNVSNRGLMSFALSQRRQRRPVVMTLHDRHIYRNLSALSREVFAYSDQIVAISEFIRHDALSHFPELAAKLETILNALPGTPIEPMPFSPGRRLLTIGRMTRDKGFDLAIEGFAQVAPEFPDSNLTMVGDGGQRQLLKELAARHGVAERVHFLGWRHPDEVNDLIDDHWAVIMPSRWEEPFGLVALQAAQRGRPICASRTGGIPEVVVEGETGWLFESGSSDDLARSLRKLFSNICQSEDMGRRAHERVLQHFDFSIFLQRYEERFAQVTSSRKKMPNEQATIGKAAQEID